MQKEFTYNAIAEGFAERMQTNCLHAYAYLYIHILEEESWMIKPYLDEAMSCLRPTRNVSDVSIMRRWPDTSFPRRINKRSQQ